MLYWCYGFHIAGTATSGAKDRTRGAAPLKELIEEIDRLTGANRKDRDLERDRRLLWLRHLAGIRLIEDAPANPEFADSSEASLPSEPGLPEVGPGDLTAELLRAAILDHGCLLVRGLVDRDQAVALAEGIERAFETRTALSEGGSATGGYYEEFAPQPPFQVAERSWVDKGGGVLAVDSPKLMFEMLEALASAGLPAVVEGYLGERPAISAQKCTLRKAEPQIGGAWHQDGKFLGDVRALNLWLALSRCGDEAPGLDIVPRRLDRVLDAGTEDTIFPIQVPQRLVEEAAGDLEVLRPIFEPGDALLFDELFLHQTGSDPQMPKPRYAIESWFFGPSAYPRNYTPLAV